MITTTMKTTTSILLLFICFQNTLIQSKLTHQLRPGGEKMLFIGIFGDDCQQNSLSLKQNQSESSKLCRTVIEKMNSDKRGFWKYALQKGQYLINDIIDADDFEYFSFSFCYHHEATEIAINLKLNASFLINNNTQSAPMWNKKQVLDWRTSSRIIFIMIYASSHETLDMYRDVFLGEKYTVIFLPTQYLLSPTFLEYNLHTTSDFLKSNSQKLMGHIDARMAERRPLRHEDSTHYLGLVYVISKADSSFYKLEFEYFRDNYLKRLYKELETCFFIYELDITDTKDVENLSNRLVADKYLHFLILIGSPDDQMQLVLKLTNKDFSKVTWILFDVGESNFKPTLKTLFTKNYWHMNSFNTHNLKFYTEPNYTLDEMVRWLNKKKEIPSIFSGDLSSTSHDRVIQLVENCKGAYEDQIIRIMQLISMYTSIGFFSGYTLDAFKNSNNRRARSSKSRTRSMTELRRVGFDNFRTHELHSEVISKAFGIKCPIPHCEAGHERYFGHITDPNRMWNDSYGWHCQKCISGHYRSNVSWDNVTCLPCLHQTLANSDQSGCYDPYQNVYIMKPVDIFSIAICCIGGLLAFVTVAIFVLSRETPLVKASDLSSSLLHLTLMLSLFVIFPVLFLGEPTWLNCTLQPIVVLVICIFPSTIVLSKSQKVLMVFKSKTRLSRRQKRKSAAKQYSMTFIIILIDSAILVLTIATKTPDVVTHYDHHNYRRIITCNTGHHINVQIILLILQHLFATIQAYRGRHLPGPSTKQCPSSTQLSLW